MIMLPILWPEVTSLTHLLGACACATVALLLLRRRRRFGPAPGWIVASLLACALWCLTMIVVGAVTPASEAVLAVRNLAWLFLLFRLFASDGRHTSMAPVRPVIIVLGFVDLLQPVAAVIESHLESQHPTNLLLFHVNIMLAVMSTIGALVLVHNLYTGAAARRVLRWPALALGLVWGYDLNLYTVAWLSNHWPTQLVALHGLVDVAFAAILALSAMEGREAMRFQPSRAVTFRLVSLLLIAVYFFAMVAVAQSLADTGGDFVRWLQLGVLIMAITLALVMLPSPHVRGWAKVMLTKHFFQHRYDYRTEWLRFTRTVGRPGEGAPPLEERAIQALADITDSPAGLLLMPGEEGDLALAARWRWPTAEAPACAFPAAGIAFLEHHDFILELDGDSAALVVPRAGKAARKAARKGAPSNPTLAPVTIPDWLAQDPRAWALVPLLHYERLVGAVVLARPPLARRLDWEDFDLLRVAGQQLASYLAENASQQALADAGRFEDFNRRIAFVMHDIKNLASQIGLLARNAERHAENPAFRADMLVTLRGSADKLNALVARLSRYGASAVERVETVAAGDVAREIATRLAASHPVTVTEIDACTLIGQRHALEQALTHLVQNGIDATKSSSDLSTPVEIIIAREPPWCRIEICDHGHGMSPEFLSRRLFRPFDSSRAGGFGIGAYEARALVQGMHGRLKVESRQGAGSRFIIRLPLAQSDAADTFTRLPAEPLTPAKAVRA